MSRIGRLPVEIPAGVEVTVAENNVVTVKGPKGTLKESLPVEMDIKVENNQVVVTRPNDLKKMKSLHGLTRTLVANMVTGVTKGYEKVLEINGVGYRAQKQGKKLILSLFSDFSCVLSNFLFVDSLDVCSSDLDLKKMKSLHGLTRTLVANMVTGVTKGYEKVLVTNTDRKSVV